MMGVVPDFTKYAVPECERRFLLDEVPTGASELVRIVDRYLGGAALAGLRPPDGAVE
jgi:hypothetical protein